MKDATDRTIGPTDAPTFDRLLNAVRELGRELEAKQNFNPDQPRRPRGTPIGGQWAPGHSGPTPAPQGSFREEAARVDAFLLRHGEAITRILGGVQALGGAGEVLSGLGLLGVGAATSEAGVGVGVALLGAWMVKNGYENVHVGWWALVTGDAEETPLNRSLRSLGLSDSQADAVEVLLGGAGGLAVARLGRGALERAAKAELARRAARAFDPRFALDVRAAGRSLWDMPDIRRRGEAWEVFDVRRTGYDWQPHARAFDQLSADRRIAVSNKTLDLRRETYLRTDRRALYQRLCAYIDSAASYRPFDPDTGALLQLTERRLHLLLRFGDAAPGQALQLAAAEQYARQSGVLLQVEYAR